MMMTLISIFCAFQAHVTPDSIEKWQASRDRIKTAELRVVAEDTRLASDKQIEYQFRLAEDGDYAFEVWGDEDGYTSWDPRGKGQSTFPVAWCRCGDEYWGGHRSSLIYERYAEYPTDSHYGPPLRLDRLGFSPRVAEVGAEKQIWEIWRLREPRWDEEVRAGRHIVTLQNGDEYVRWTLDPSKDWAADEIEFGYGTPPRGGRTKPSLVMTAAYQKVDGVWFPESVVYIENGAPVATYQVVEAKFNNPDGPKRITPADIGVEVGTNVTAHEMPGVSVLWNGKELVSSDEFFAGEREGLWKVGENMLRARRGEPSLYASPQEVANWRASMLAARIKFSLKGKLSSWERYTRSFILRYDLDEDQSQQALRVLKECQTRGNELLDRRRDQIEKLEAQAADPKIASDPKRAKAIEAQLDELTAPLTEIFEKTLKPRLDEIPTQAQRKMAEGPASRPAKPQTLP